MAKQRQSAAQAAVTHLAKSRWRVKYRATLPANSRVNSRTKVVPLVQQLAKPQRLEPRD